MRVVKAHAYGNDFVLLGAERSAEGGTDSQQVEQLGAGLEREEIFRIGDAGQRQILPSDWAELCELLTVPGASRAARGGTSGAGRGSAAQKPKWDVEQDRPRKETGSIPESFTLTGINPRKMGGPARGRPRALH